jgi:hypothetical protein
MQTFILAAVGFAFPIVAGLYMTRGQKIKSIRWN